MLSYQLMEFKNMNALDLGESTSQEVRNCYYRQECVGEAAFVKLGK